MTTERTAMKIKSRDFQVQEGHKVNLKKWPTRVTPHYNSKEQYQKLLEDQVSELSALQQLHYASNRYAVLLFFLVLVVVGLVGVFLFVLFVFFFLVCLVFCFL